MNKKERDEFNQFIQKRILDDDMMCSYLDQGKFDYFYFHLNAMKVSPYLMGLITEFLIKSDVEGIIRGLAGVPNNFLYKSTEIKDITIDPISKDGYVVGASAFAHSNIENIKFEPGLKSIGMYAFFNCRKLKRLEFPEGLDTIRQCAIKNCSNLEELVLPKSLFEIGTENFIGVPYKCKIIYNGSEFQWAALRMNENDRTIIKRYFTNVEFRG